MPLPILLVNIITMRLFVPCVIYNFWIYLLAVFILPFTVVPASYKTITSL